MTPREALYHLSMALGPVTTKRNDNLSEPESVVRDSMTTLQAWVDAEVDEGVRRTLTHPSGRLFEITERNPDTIAEAWRESYNPAHHTAEHQEQMVASGVKIWDWGTGEITDETVLSQYRYPTDAPSSATPSYYDMKAQRPFNSIEPSASEVRADGFSTETETAGEMDGTAGSDSYTDGLINDIIEWHYDRNLIHGSTDKDQFCKLIQECGELSDNLCKGNDIKDDIGDIMVVLINIAERNEVCISECLNVAYEDIKDRKGRMVDGVFVKED